MELSCLPLPPLGANCYLLKNGERCLILDPGGDAPQVAAQCRALCMTPAAILLTHGHFDHVGGISGLLEVWPELPVYCHPGDVSDVPGQFTWAKCPTWRPLVEGLDLCLAGLPIQVLHTPGHSQGSCCLRIGECLFTGDTLFRGSVGRTDLPGGDPKQMSASLARLAALEGDLPVYPGHDRATTLDRERLQNPYLRAVAP